MMKKILRETIAVLFLLTIAALLAFMVMRTAGAQTLTRSAKIEFVATTMFTDGDPITTTVSYEIYQGLKGAPKSKVGTISTTTATVSTGLLAGKEYCWHVVAVVAGYPPSDPSGEKCKSFPLPQPNTVTITVT